MKFRFKGNPPAIACLLVAICHFFVSLKASRADCVSLPAGLIAWWRGESNTLDSVGANHGTLQNGATFISGEIGQAFSFDGADDFIQLNNAMQNPFPVTGFTYEGWIQLNATQSGSRATLISNHETFGNWWNGVSLTGNQIIEVTLQNGSTGRWVAWFSTNSVPTNQFSHFAIAYHYSDVASNDLEIYFNGVRQVVTNRVFAGDYTQGFAPGYGASDPLGLVLGRTQEDSPRGYFGGKLDELAFYDRTLSSNEVAAIFAAGSAGKCLQCSPSATNLLASWRAENNALDDVGTKHGSLVNGATFAAGQVGQAFSFNASANAGVIVPSAPSLNPTEAITIEAWVKPFSYPNPGLTIVRKDQNGGGGTTQYGLLIGDGLTLEVLHFNLGGSAFVTGSSVPSNVWTHVAATYDLQFLRLYVNGGEVASAPGTAPIPTSSQDLVIGKEALFTDRNFDGLIDEVSLYGRALSATEIQAIVNAGSAGKCFTPSLQAIGAGPGLATISWKPNTPGFVLQESPNLFVPTWTNSASSGTNPINVPATLPAKFYRLHKP